MVAGIGGKDANGVFLYGEATPIDAQFSDYMNRAQTPLSELIGKLRDHRAAATFIGTAIGASPGATLASFVFAPATYARKYLLSANQSIANSATSNRGIFTHFAVTLPTGTGAAATVTDDLLGPNAILASTSGQQVISGGVLEIPANSGCTLTFSIYASVATGVSTANANGTVRATPLLP